MQIKPIEKIPIFFQPDLIRACGLVTLLWLMRVKMWLGFYSGDVHLQGHCSEMAKKDSFVNLNDNIFSIVWSGSVQSLPNYSSNVNKSNCDLK